MTQLSKRQIAAQEFERKHGSEGRAWNNPRQHTSMESLKRSYLLDMRAKRLLASGPPVKKRPQPLPLHIERRARALGIIPPDSLTDGIDAKIRNQIATQREKYHPILHFLYDTWSYANAAFFGGQLQLPIINIEPLEHSLANCSITGAPTVITFNSKTIRNEDRETIADILTHEMIHQHLGEKYTNAKFHIGNDGHHAEFATICNQISKARGWATVSHEIREGAQACRYWPPRAQH